MGDPAAPQQPLVLRKKSNYNQKRPEHFANCRVVDGRVQADIQYAGIGVGAPRRWLECELVAEAVPNAFKARIRQLALEAYAQAGGDDARAVLGAFFLAVQGDPEALAAASEANAALTPAQARELARASTGGRLDGMSVASGDSEAPAQSVDGPAGFPAVVRRRPGRPPKVRAAASAELVRDGGRSAAQPLSVSEQVMPLRFRQAGVVELPAVESAPPATIVRDTTVQPPRVESRRDALGMLRRLQTPRQALRRPSGGPAPGAKRPSARTPRRPLPEITPPASPLSLSGAQSIVGKTARSVSRKAAAPASPPYSPPASTAESAAPSTHVAALLERHRACCATLARLQQLRMMLVRQSNDGVLWDEQLQLSRYRGSLSNLRLDIAAELELAGVIVEDVPSKWTAQDQAAADSLTLARDSDDDDDEVGLLSAARFIAQVRCGFEQWWEYGQPGTNESDYRWRKHRRICDATLGTTPPAPIPEEALEEAPEVVADEKPPAVSLREHPLYVEMAALVTLTVEEAMIHAGERAAAAKQARMVAAPQPIMYAPAWPAYGPITALPPPPQASPVSQFAATFGPVGVPLPPVGAPLPPASAPLGAARFPLSGVVGGGAVPGREL